MEQDSAIGLYDEGADTSTGKDKRLVAPNRRAQVLRSASAQFALTGLHGTTNLTLAQVAGISEAFLSIQFGNKTQLFREAVEMNIETRLRLLDGRLSSIAAENQVDWIESMAEATMMACLGDAANCDVDELGSLGSSRIRDRPLSK